MTHPLGTEFEASAWFYLKSQISRAEAEEQIAIAFNRICRADSMVLANYRLTERMIGEDRVPPPPAGIPTHTGLRLLHGEATLVAYAPATDDVWGPDRPFISTLTRDDIKLLRRVTRKQVPFRISNDVVDAIIEQLGPDMVRRTILAGGVPR